MANQKLVGLTILLGAAALGSTVAVRSCAESRSGPAIAHRSAAYSNPSLAAADEMRPADPRHVSRSELDTGAPTVDAHAETTAEPSTQESPASDSREWARRHRARALRARLEEFERAATRSSAYSVMSQVVMIRLDAVGRYEILPKDVDVPGLPTTTDETYILSSLGNDEDRRYSVTRGEFPVFFDVLGLPLSELGGEPIPIDPTLIESIRLAAAEAALVVQ
ncbi:MAG: hypothetical protein IT453_18015 [Planctomycetes bacterium]|nr:hypothetical protein [Planctomycetota bacterium]